MKNVSSRPLDKQTESVAKRSPENLLEAAGELGYAPGATVAN